MSPPVRTDPPYVPIRQTRWATRRTPWWVLAAVAVVLAGMVLVALVHKPSQAERASDLRGFLGDMQADIGSCAAGVSQSLAALRQIESGASHDVKTAVYIANTGSSNCSPANNELLDDLDGYQVTESLASFGLGRAVSGLVAWAAPDAVDAQTDVARILTARQQGDSQAEASATTALHQALRALDAQRSAVDKIMESANKSLSAHGTLPNLPNLPE
jgi:multidrug efflux pump subunit AcrB